MLITKNGSSNLAEFDKLNIFVNIWKSFEKNFKKKNHFFSNLWPLHFLKRQDLELLSKITYKNVFILYESIFGWFHFPLYIFIFPSSISPPLCQKTQRIKYSNKYRKIRNKLEIR